MSIPDKWLFNENGQEIEVAPERWVWEAIYHDGTCLEQFDQNGRFHQFREIDQQRLAVFVMRKINDPMKRYELHMRAGMKPIHYYINTVLEAGTPCEKRFRTYCFGYQENIYGHNATTLIEINYDDTVSIRNKDTRIKAE